MEKLSHQSLPQSITEDILRYLEQQDLLTGEDDFHIPDGDTGYLQVQSLLEQIIERIANRADYIEDYQARVIANNQYPLFDLSDIISDFCIDDELYEKLTFRETLVISSFKISEDSLAPEIVGGLCLDIQTAKSKNPLFRRRLELHQKLVEMLTSIQNINKAKGDKNSIESTYLWNRSSTSQSDEDLKKFEATLKPHYEPINNKFLVHLSSQFDVEGHLGGSRITAWVDKKFHTLEENRTEFINENDVTYEKKLYCGIQPRRYYIKHTSKPENILDKKYYSMGKAKYLISEGANFILMRYLAITRYMGNFELSTMYINGDMCRNIYECTGPESGLVNEQKLDLCKICRTIFEECGIEHHCITLLTLNGQIIKQEWNDCEYILQINPLACIKNEKPSGNEHLRLSKVWETDMQLLSNYLDSKTTCTMHMKSYLADHPEFKNMMDDYVESALLMKPDSVLDFTINYFSRFASRNFQESDYLSQMEEEYHFHV